MKRRTLLSVPGLCFWYWMLTPLYLVARGPVLPLDSDSPPTQEMIRASLHVLPQASPEMGLAAVVALAGDFVSYEDNAGSLLPGQYHWALLQIENLTPYLQQWVLLESDEGEMQTYVMEGHRLVYAGRSGQLVPLAEEQVPEGIHQEARLYLQLAPGHSQQIYLRAGQSWGYSPLFDLSLQPYDRYQAKLRKRNLYQGLFQGAMWLLLIYHVVMFLMTGNKNDGYYAVYLLLLAVFFLHFYGFSKEWLLGSLPRLSYGLWMTPGLIAAYLMRYLHQSLRRYYPSGKWHYHIDYLFYICHALFGLAMLLMVVLEHWNVAVWITNFMVVMCLVGIGYLMVQLYRSRETSLIFFLIGTLFFCLITSGAFVLFLFTAAFVGTLIQLGIMAQVLIFALGMGYQQQLTSREKRQAQQALIRQLEQNHALESEIKRTLEDKVRQRTAALEEQKNALQIAKEQAEKALQLKSDFLDLIRHQVRTPMHAVLGMSNLLLEEGPRQDQEEMINTLKIASENLLGQINNILEFSRLEAGEIAFNQEDFEMPILLYHVSSTVQPLLQQKQLDWKLELDPHIPLRLRCDTFRLQQILGNLLDNAISFTENGQVKLIVKSREQNENRMLVYFAVQDTGIGIAPERYKQIFEGPVRHLYDTDSSQHNKGFGLAIVSRLLQLLGSQIHFESEPGRGSRFYFELWLTLADSYDKAPTIHGKRVLLVEDNLVNQKVAISFLQRWGMHIQLATNGQEALEHLQQQPFDLVLMDLHMPVMDGYEAASTIRAWADPVISRIPIVALSAAAAEDTRTRALAAGIRHFVAKPFNPSELKHKIEEALIEQSHRPD